MRGERYGRRFLDYRLAFAYVCRKVHAVTGPRRLDVHLKTEVPIVRKQQNYCTTVPRYGSLKCISEEESDHCVGLRGSEERAGAAQVRPARWDGRRLDEWCLSFAGTCCALAGGAVRRNYPVTGALYISTSVVLHGAMVVTAWRNHRRDVVASDATPGCIGYIINPSCNALALAAFTFIFGHRYHDIMGSQRAVLLACIIGYSLTGLIQRNIIPCLLIKNY